MPRSSSRLDPYYRFINDRLIQLRDIEKKVDTLVAETGDRLQRLGTPKKREETFPLMPLIASIRSIYHDLSGVTSRSPSVQVTKSSISDRLAGVHYKLSEAKRRWNEAISKLPHGSSPAIAVTKDFYDAGEFTLVMQPSRSTEGLVFQKNTALLFFLTWIQSFKHRCLQWWFCKLSFTSAGGVATFFY